VNYIRITQADWNAISQLVDLGVLVALEAGSEELLQATRAWKRIDIKVKRQIRHKFKMDRMQKVEKSHD